MGLYPLFPESINFGEESFSVNPGEFALDGEGCIQPRIWGVLPGNAGRSSEIFP